MATFKHKLQLFSFVAAVLFFAGCGKRVEKPEEMSFDTLKNHAMSFVERNKHDQAIVYLEQLIAQYPENQDVFEYKFILADLYMKVGRLEEAHQLYKHYTRMYPSEVKAEQAHYKSILAKFYQTLKVSKACDDTDAHQTLAQCKAYLGNLMYQEYRNDVKDIQYTCERRLIDKEIYVFNTYLRRRKFQSAANRVAYMRKTFLEKYPALEAQILFLEGKLEHKRRNPELAKNKVEELYKKFPESRYTKMASSMISAKPDTFTF